MDLKKKLILTIILLSYFVTAMDGAVIITGLEKIASELHLSQSALSWVQNAYVLAWGGFMLLGGKLSDTFGRKSILNLSFAIFGVSSFMAGISSSDWLLIFARFLQGVGAAILAPTSLALIVDCFKGMERVRAIAWYSSISGLGLSVGLVVGGILAGLFSWRYGFFINIPILLFMLIISIKVLTTRKGKKQGRILFDMKGTVLSVVGIFTFVYAINGAKSPWLWMLISLCILSVFVIVEAKSEAPIMPLRLFNFRRSRANFARILFSGSMMGFYFFISEYLQEALHLSPLWIGIAFFPLTLSTFIAAIEVPRVIRQFGNMKVLLFGQLLMLSGFIMMLDLNGNSLYWKNIAMPMLFLGIGQGFTMSPLTNIGIAGVEREDTGAASGIVNAAHQIGCSVGLSVMVSASVSVSGIVQTCHVAMMTGLVFTVLSISILFIQKQYITKITLILKEWKQ